MLRRLLHVAICCLMAFPALVAVGEPVFQEEEEFCEGLSEELLKRAKELQRASVKSLESYERLHSRKIEFELVCSKMRRLEKMVQGNPILRDLLADFQKLYQRADFSASAEQCGKATVDTSHMPDNRDQKRLKWCHAYNTADLLSFYTGTKLSAYDIAAQRLMQSGSPVIGSISDSGGFVYADLKWALNSSKGVCAESSLRPSDGDWEKLSDLIDRMTEPKSGRLMDHPCATQIQEAFTSLTPLVADVIDKLDPNWRFAALLDMQCGSRVRMPEAARDFNSDEALLPGMDRSTHKAIEKALSQGRPIGISYDSNFLKKKKSKNPAHSSTLIGRRFHQGRCQYLIRNSWGTDCKKSNYSPAVECVEGTGNVWVSRDDLFRNLMAAHDIGSYFGQGGEAR